VRLIKLIDNLQLNNGLEFLQVST